MALGRPLSWAYRKDYLNCALSHTMSSNVSNYSAPQPPHKRRKLARNRPSPTSQSTPAKVPTTTNTNKLTTISIPICSSCHRALNVTPSYNICARCLIYSRSSCHVLVRWAGSFHRCLSILCTVCSRTCTASAASQPPTPHLTWSPTPSPTPAGDSPRRSALSINSPNTNVILDTHTINAIAGKRRKFVDQDDPACTIEDRDEFGPGCGRLLCRNCCFENNQKYVKPPVISLNEFNSIVFLCIVIPRRASIVTDLLKPLT